MTRAPSTRSAIWAVLLILAASAPVSARLAAAASVTAAGPTRSDEASPEAQALLLSGVRAFRAEHFEEALQLFRRASSEHGVLDIGFYEGMSLHKLGRHAEALAAFRAAHRAGLREPIADYYAAVSSFRLGMYARAQHEFLALAATPALGPRLAQGAQLFLRSIERSGLRPAIGQSSAPLLTERLDAALGQADAALSPPSPELIEWLTEAAELLALSPERGAAFERFQQLVARVQRLDTREGLTVRVRLDELTLLSCRAAGDSGCPR